MASLQSEDFISETVGLLILNELRIMRRNLKTGLLKLETKVDSILCDYDDSEEMENSILISNKLESENNNTRSDHNSAYPVKTLDFSRSEDSVDDETAEATIFDTSNEMYTIKIDVTELPDDISLESYDEDEDKDAHSSEIVKESSVNKTKKNSSRKAARTENTAGEEEVERIFPLLETADGRYQCSLCSSSFTKKGNLRRHYRYHTNDKRYTCQVCWKKFFRRECLFAHVRRHTDEELSKASLKELGDFDKVHTCKYCNRTFSLSSNLKRHLRLHTGEKPYACAFCDEKFNRDDTLKRHIQKQHS